MIAIDREPLDTVVADFATAHHCPTVAWGVIVDGALVLTGAIDQVGRVAVGPTTAYRIASVTKSFSAAATLALRDDGVLRLDDPIHTHAPELAGLRSPTTDAPAITIRDLLQMTSGLVTDDPWADRHLDLTDDEFDAIVTRGAVFATPTGTANEYSNFGFAILGRVVHRATGRRIQDHVTDRLLDPLGLDATTWTRPDHDRWAPPLRRIDGRFVDELPPVGDGLIAPMGGLWSTVTDLARWVCWLDDAFPARDGPDDGPVRRAARRELQAPHSYVGHRTTRGVRAPMSYGYGLRVVDEPRLGRVVHHSGGFPGYGANIRWLPGRRIGAVALSNRTYAPMTELTALLLDVLADRGLVPPEPRPVSPAVADAAHRLIALLGRWDDAVADRLFTDNVPLDDAYERRRAEAAAVAPLRLDHIDPINDARATVHCTSGSGERVTVRLVLATDDPARIQHYDVTRSA